VGLFDKFSKAYRAYDSSTYKETMQSVEKIAGASLRLLADKSREEQTQLLGRVTELSEKLHDAIDHETPLVISLTLLMAIRVHEQALLNQADSR
jgi:hypothetical protein